MHQQYEYMQKLYQEEQDRIKREKEMAQQRNNAAGTQAVGGFASRLFSVFKPKIVVEKEVLTQAKQKTIDEVDYDNEENFKEDAKEEYLISTNVQEKPVESANLLDLDEDDNKGKNHEKIQEKEIPMKLEDQELQDDHDATRTESDTVQNEDDRMEESQDFTKQRDRSDSLTSTSTSRIYSHQTFSDFMNIDELHKFLYKCGALLSTKKGKMEQWIEWMQRTLAEYYVYCQVLYKQAKDVEILKDFLAQKVQKLKYKLDQVINEKEDLIEQQAAEVGIKEYLAKQMQELNKKNVEKTHELVLVKQKLAEFNQDYNDMKQKYEVRV